MKKTFTFCIGLVISLGCLSQMQNGDFETWYSMSIYLPDGWNNLNGDTKNSGLPTPATPFSPALAENNSIKMETASYTTNTGSVPIMDDFRFANAPAVATPLEVFSLGTDRISSYDFNLYGVVAISPDSAQYSFVYSTDPGFATSASTTTKTISSASLEVVYGSAASLTPASTYYFFLKATSSQGTVNSDTLQFYTDTLSPLFVLPGASVYGSFVEMHGRLSGLTGSHTVSFEYGEKPNQLDSVILSDAGTITNGNGYYPRAFVNGFPMGKLYFYRMKAVGSTDSLFTDIRPFYTGTPYSTLQSMPATSVGSTTADMNGKVQGFPVPLKLSIEYGTQYYGIHPAPFYLETNNTLHDFSYAATGLLSERLYGYRLKAESWLGNFFGSDIFFITGNQDSVMLTVPATNVSSTSATLNGLTQNFGFQLGVGFEYGTTPALGTYVETDTIMDSLAYYQTTNLNGLLPNTTYYFALRAGYQWMNGATVYADTLQFTTDPSGIEGTTTIPANITLYPNPAGSQIQLLGESNDFSFLRIYDLLGKEILNCTTPATNRLDVSFLSPGVYFINTFNKAGDKTNVVRFIKKQADLH